MLVAHRGEPRNDGFGLGELRERKSDGSRFELASTDVGALVGLHVGTERDSRVAGDASQGGDVVVQRVKIALECGSRKEIS